MSKQMTARISRFLALLLLITIILPDPKPNPDPDPNPPVGGEITPGQPDNPPDITPNSDNSDGSKPKPDH